MRRRVCTPRHSFLHARYLHLQADSRTSNVYGTTSFLHPPPLARHRQWTHRLRSRLFIEVLSISNKPRFRTSRFYRPRCWTPQSLSIPRAPGSPREIPWPRDVQPLRCSRQSRRDEDLVPLPALRRERRKVRRALQLHRLHKR